MAKTKIVEAAIILKQLTKAQLGALHAVRGDQKFKEMMSVINQIILTDKEKIVGVVSDVKSADDAIEKASKQNFYRGRINSLVLLHALMVNAEEEFTRREGRESAVQKGGKK